MENPFRNALSWVRATVVAASLALLASSTSAQIYINEIYFDPPGSGGDNRSEFIELRGAPGASLANRYLIFLENESSLTANAGLIEAMFDLTSYSLGTNGFLTIRQHDNSYPSPAPGTTDLVNSGTRFGRPSLSLPSTVGFSDIGSDGKLENSGFTALLIDIGNGVAPLLEQDLDIGDNGLTDDGLPSGWTILDGIGVISELSETSGRLYGLVNFSAGTPEGGPNVEPGAVFVDVGAELEYVGRWGNSTGSTAADWHATNLTDDSRSGWTGGTDFRQAAEPHGIPTNFPTGQFVESSQGVPYGKRLVDTLGAPNFSAIDGDFEYIRDADSDGQFDGDVDGGDFLIWQQNSGVGDGTDGTREFGDANADRVIDSLDLAVWMQNYGSFNASSSVNYTVVPEPGAFWVALVSLGAFLQFGRVKR